MGVVGGWEGQLEVTKQIHIKPLLTEQFILSALIWFEHSVTNQVREKKGWIYYDQNR